MNSKTVRFILRIYALIALIVAAVFSPLALSFVPVLLLLWALYQWRWPVSPFVAFMTQFFLYFATGLLFSLSFGPYLAFLISLPLLYAVDIRFRDIGRLMQPDKSHHRRRPTNFSIVVTAITVSILALALITGNVNLMLSGGLVLIYLITVNLIVWRGLSLQPVTVNPVQLRMVAGTEGQTDIVMACKSRLPVTLFIESPYDWTRIKPDSFIPLTGRGVVLKASVTPVLSGPESIKVKSHIIDPWGLTQSTFDIELLKLITIPRARYAEWLARKYMSGTKPGQLPLISNIGSINPLYGLRRGIEFYGLKMYQPGDSMKNIDWKHSVKYNELVSKEFSEVQAQPAIILVNLVADSAEEKDKLAYNIIVAALCLAQDGIPAALAAYDDAKSVIATQSLSGRELVTSALQIVKDIKVQPDTTRYLAPPDIDRLRANISRLDRSASQPAKALVDLLRIEYKSLANSSKNNPCTQSVSEVVARTNQLSTIIVISGRNHDAEALAFNMHVLTGKGNAVIAV